MREQVLQWHPAFQAVMQIELQEDKDYLQFEKEYNLTEKPLQMDTLIIKLRQGHQIRKSIGRIFRQYNVVEYKSPSDYVSINDFYRVMGYAGIFQSNTEKIQERSPKEITITFVANKYPGKLMAFLKEQYQVQVEKVEEGIYYLYGLMFPVQFLWIPELAKEEYVWLSRLREDLQTEDADCLSQAYVGKNRNPLYEAAMDLIIKANREVYEEAREMCEAIRELFADEFAKQEQEYERRRQEYERQQQEYERQQQEYERQQQEYERQQQEYERQQQEYEQNKRELIQQGISALVETCMEVGLSKALTQEKLIAKFGLKPEEAQMYVTKYWNHND